MPGFGAREFGCCVTQLMLWSVVTAFGVATAATLLPNAQADTGSFSVDSNQPRISPPSQSGLENSAVNAVAPEAEFADENGVDSGQYVLSDLVINRRDIFGSETAEANATPRLYRVIDALHVTTREKTILLETGLKPGQRVIASDVAELERNLRALGIFASVSVKLIPIDDNHAEIHIQTRDRLSVVFGAAGSFLGGIGQLGFTVGERNVNGSGDRLLLSYSGTTDGDLRGAIAYDDIHFINRHHAASYSLGQTDEGRFYQFQVSRPFKTLASKFSWSLGAESVGSEVDFFENGVSVAQVPLQRESLVLQGSRRFATDKWSSVASSFRRYFRYGAVLRVDRRDFEPTIGIQPDFVTPPLDNTRTFAGALLEVSRNRRFEKTTGVDTVQFTEDLSFGYSAELLAGVERMDDSADVTETEPELFLEARYAFGSSLVNVIAEDSNSAPDSAIASAPVNSGRLSLLPAQSFGTVSFNGFSNLQSGDDRSWSAAITLKLFNRAIDSHTLASRISYIKSDRGSDLPAQFTLGENNGLRGYSARQFSGSSRLRINLEDRIFTGWRVGAIDVGLLAFVDAGWAGDDFSELSLNTSAGLGLRLGSNSLLGADILRLDVAYPFDRVDGDPAVSVSLAMGQVFSF